MAKLCAVFRWTSSGGYDSGSDASDTVRATMRPSQLLGDMLRAAAAGRFPAADGSVDVIRPFGTGHGQWVVSFTGHAVVVTDRESEAVRAQGVDGYGSALAPEFLLWLAGEGGHVGCQDAVLVSYGNPGPGLPRRDDLDDHPRVRHARTLRSDVEVYGDETGFVTMGIGLGGLAEFSLEVTADHGRGHGRSLIRRALELAGPDEIVVAEVTPGNARSLRAFLASGFVPVGSAVAVSRRNEPSASRPR